MKWFFNPDAYRRKLSAGTLVVFLAIMLSFPGNARSQGLSAIGSCRHFLLPGHLSPECIAGLNDCADSVSTPFHAGTGKNRWSSFLPFKKQEALSRGYELPLPLGISANVVHLKREVEVKDISAAINAPPRDLNDYIAINTNSCVSSTSLRLDAWIFPFLNLYALGGYVENKTKLSATLTLPPLLPGGTPNVIPVNTEAELDGSVLGAGMTLAAGYDDFFLSLDANYTDADLEGVIDQKIDVFLYSFRSGWRGRIGRFMTNIWLGGMYWDSEREIKGSIPIDSENILHYRVLQGPVEPFNYLTGVSIEFSKAFQMMLEYGYNFDDLQMVTTSLSYRF